MRCRGVPEAVWRGLEVLAPWRWFRLSEDRLCWPWMGESSLRKVGWRGKDLAPMGFAGQLSGLKPLPQGVPVESEAAFRKGASEIFFLQVESGQLLRALSQGCWLSG